MKNKVERAFQQFDDGERPENYRTARNWYVLNKERKLYPAKAIWSLATEISLSEFNTREARDGFADLGYLLFDGKTIEEMQEQSSSTESDVRKYLTVTVQYERDEKIKKERLKIANSYCESCKSPAPFVRKTNGEPYLEVHHILPLSQGGADTLENTIALCPNCHRKAHYA
jgi:5-methylcytosine-specific restriction protein A